MPDKFVFGSVDSSNFGIQVFRPKKIQIPDKPYDFASIPGQLGSIITGPEKVNNEIISYPCVMVAQNGAYGNYSTLKAAYSAFRNALLCTRGFQTLTDTFDTDHSRKACFPGPMDVTPTKEMDQAKFNVQFTAKPQRYGLDFYDFMSGTGTTTLDAREVNFEPVITIRRSLANDGTIQFSTGGTVIKTITVKAGAGALTIDSMLRDCYKSNGESANRDVAFSDYKFPLFGPYYGNAAQITVTLNLPDSGGGGGDLPEALVLFQAGRFDL